MRTDNTFSVLALVGSASAFWRMECRGVVGLARLDPLVNPGTAAAHVHAIHGSSAFSESVTYDELRNGECTSCAVKEDLSAYWHPPVYFKHTNGTYEMVPQMGGMLAYYFLNKDDADPNKGIKAFPNDLRMLAGDSARRDYNIPGASYKQVDPEKSMWAALGQTTQSDLAQRAIGFNCLNYGRAPEQTLMRHYMPDKSFIDANCANGVRIEIMFPSCWNGKDTDSPNHKDHVAYPDLVMEGNCPKGFPVKLPGLMYEIIWATEKFIGIPGEFILAHGDESGFGYHADFISGWDENFLQQAVDQCTNLSGRLTDCPIFSLKSEDEQRQCQMKPRAVNANERVTGLLTVLPGQGSSPAPAPPAPAAPAPSVPEPDQHGAAAPPPPPAPAPAAPSSSSIGGVFAEKPSAPAAPAPPPAPATPPAPAAPSPSKVVALSVPAPPPAPTPSPEEPAPVDDGFAIIRTDWITNGKLVSKIVVKEKVEYVTVLTTTATVTVEGTFPTRLARRELERHRHHHHPGRL